MIRAIEELSINAWPALETMLYDGWVLRFANGYTRRANSVNPLYPSALSVGEKIQTCEYLYRSKGLPVVFKMTSTVFPENLDSELDHLGYQVQAPTSVQLLQLDGIGEGQKRASIVCETLSEDWLTDFWRLSDVNKQHQAAQQQMLSQLAPQAGFFSIRQDRQTIACGMGVVQGQFVGLFDIVTDVDRRNHGHGRQLVSDLLAWGKERGAQTAYLQVMLNNPIAQRLYAKLGFKESYQYWYRVKR